MCKLLLVRPSEQYAEQVMSYKEEMSQYGNRFDGCAGLENVQSFEEWIDFRHPLSDFLFHFGGNIGYRVRPSEREKGYASEIEISDTAGLSESGMIQRYWISII